MKPHRIAILVVHGVGDQTCFDPLKSIASNLFLALDKNPKRQPQLQVLQSEDLPSNGAHHNWREIPVVLCWKEASGEQWEFRFREAHWADLGEPMTPWRWLRMVGWALGMSGIRLYKKSGKGLGAMPGMEFPAPLAMNEIRQVRAELFGVSLLFLLMLFSADLLQFLLSRLSIHWAQLERARGLLYNYLGDVKLYQDWYVREDESPEVIGEKSRVAIRRRMVQALVRTAVEYQNQAIDGYYIVAHSLGTVVAFNALMEPDITLPNFLTEEEWQNLPADFKCQASTAAPDFRSPRRPAWLNPNDAIDRSRLFAGLKGFLTLGSPLDKFAALWPAIVPTNDQPLPRETPWINVADVQDIVAGTLESIRPRQSQEPVGGLWLKNFQWAGAKQLFIAHTSYWKSQEGNDQRLIDRLISWLQGQAFQAPANDLNPTTAKLLFRLSLVLLGVIGLLVAGLLVVLMGWLMVFSVSFPAAVFAVLLVGIAVIAASSWLRHRWEMHRFGDNP